MAHFQDDDTFRLWILNMGNIAPVGVKKNYLMGKKKILI